VQQAFLPQQYPTIPLNAPPEESALKFCHRYLPTTLVGGDFFHIFALSDDEAGVLICDVMGHGVFAALITAVQRVLAEELEPVADDPGAFLCELNRRLLSVLKRAQTPILVTAFYLTINTSTGKIRFTNAGHPKPLHVKHGEETVGCLARCPASDGQSPGRSHEVDPALGLFDFSVYHTHEAQLAPGDTIVLYTDGIYDVDRADGKYLTEDTLPEFVRPLARARGESLLDGIIGEIQKFAMGSPFADDVCVVGIELAKKVMQV
jgi:sigma-B regulation protein RsbU (phosphoserine phosphatase)